MFNGGESVRALRPSQAMRRDALREDIEQVKLEKIRRYCERAASGLPLFDDDEIPAVSLHTAQ